MKRTGWSSHHFLSQIAVVCALCVLSLGLAGCYTQLETVDRGPTQGSLDQQAAEEPVYADEYRREYRKDESYADPDDGRTVLADGEYDYLYKYKYKYGSPYRYRGSSANRWCEEAFFHDPWYYDDWCGPSYGSRFSLSFHFGSPYYYSRPYYSRPWGSYYSSWHRYSYGGAYSPYGNHYFGNYYYYGSVDGSGSDREYRPRGGTIGRGATGTDRRRTADRSVTEGGTMDRSVHSSSSQGRIGRSARAAERRSAVDRGTRSSSERGRVGRTTARERDRVTRTRQTTRADRPRRTTRTRSGDRSSGTRTDRGSSRSDDRTRRPRRQSSDDDGNRRSQYRSPTPDRSDSQTRERDRRTNSDRSGGNQRRVAPSSDRSSSSTRSSSRDRSRSDASRSSRSSSRSDRGSDDGDSR